VATGSTMRVSTSSSRDRRLESRVQFVHLCGCLARLHSGLTGRVCWALFQTCAKDGKELRVMHPRWTTDIKKLEKAWALQQARKRELAEVCVGATHVVFRAPALGFGSHIRCWPQVADFMGM